MQYDELDLKRILAGVLKVSVDAIGEETSMDTVEAWDSLQHLKLVLALEEHFDISFTDEETIEMLNYLLIKIILQEHGIVFNNA